MILAHVMNGPLDAIVELGVPVVVFAVLWWWSSRSAKKGRQK